MMRARSWAFAGAFVTLSACCAFAADAVSAYHNGPARSGAYVVPGLTLAAARNLHNDAGFHAILDGHVYAQPLFAHLSGGRPVLLVATESNVVAALDAKSGATVWQRTVGAPVSRSALPCGNIDPDGITGTPVLDLPGRRIYFDALIQTQAGPRHLVYALSLDNGSTVSGYPLDVEKALEAFHAEFSSLTQGERGALSLFGGKLYVPFGGNWGDCGTYRGTVVEIDPPSAKLTAVWQTRANGGGIWAPGGLASDGKSLFAVTGNTFDASQFAFGEAVVRLKTGLAPSSDPADLFTPSDWKRLDEEDTDLGGTDALPLDPGGAARLIAFGKDGKAYLLDRNRLGGVGGALAVMGVSNHAIITAPAVLERGGKALVAFASRGGGRCASENITMLTVGPKGLGVAWCAPFSGAGAPIITTSNGSDDAIVWVTGAEGDNRLHGFDAASGKPVFAGGPAMPGLRHMGTLIVAEGRLYIAADGTVYALAPR